MLYWPGPYTAMLIKNSLDDTWEYVQGGSFFQLFMWREVPFISQQKCSHVHLSMETESYASLKDKWVMFNSQQKGIHIHLSTLRESCPTLNGKRVMSIFQWKMSFVHFSTKRESCPPIHTGQESYPHMSREGILASYW